MTSKTLLLAAAAVLSLGVGSAFAQSDGGGDTYGDAQYWNSPAGRLSQVAPNQQASGANAGDTTMRSASHAAKWSDFSSDGAGG